MSISKDTPFLLAYVSSPNMEHARELASALIEAKTVACVSILPGIESHYQWKGQLESSQECLLLLKTSKDSIAELKRLVEKLHPYEVPELICTEIVEGLAPYLRWMQESMQE